MKHYASVTWNGSGLEGEGFVSMQSKTFDRKPFTFNSRFNAAEGTNPEELLAAAYASDFSMKLSFVCAEAGLVPGRLKTDCFIHYEYGRISRCEFRVKAKIRGLTEELLQRCATEAINSCPITQLLTIERSLETIVLK